ncbi:single-stranded DNA-binding protein [Common bottlenose dolphin gammaherpesvirus 1 strain Sarasota]|uniref:Single-stranded DNA-binding protein n=1 Tax=Common bottlenose dolphin gammaherpesvirus 1 strain Sarasota TaxID=2022783 RepID=A0A1Z1NEF6_9GAMA|nr:single-stranded DNA-binding protein [Common bottlenose dolphin gammaherpesvirus 1 strain Sarasota]ARW78073.1 single-stranded DNA-binding protein [Common bottlenose dolphin gammaherpesvirus 1 strain Sarasota]
MSSKAQQAQIPPEDNIASRSQVGPCGYIYLYPADDFPVEEASLLGNLYVGGRVLSLPLLQGLTVEKGFNFNVKAAYRKVDATTLSVKVTSYHHEALIFHNVEAFKPIFAGPGLEELCDAARGLFGFAPFTAPGGGAKEFSVQDLRGPFLPAQCICAAVVTEGFKERLYYGKLIPLPSQIQEVKIGSWTAFKVPLYDQDLFPQHHASMKKFYRDAVSRYLYESLYTNLAMAFRVRNVPALIAAVENQFMHDQYKLPKVSAFKEYPEYATKHPNASSLMIVDGVATELAMSYGLSFIEAPQEVPPTLDYENWPILAACGTPKDRLDALTEWNAQQAAHVNVHVMSTNSVLYVTRVQKQTAAQNKNENVYNSFYLANGLGHATDATFSETGQPAFGGLPASALDDGAFTLEHLAYAACFSPHLLARYCYYLQFCQHQRSASNPSYNVSQYVGTAANTDACSVCHGACPASCIQTLFYRLKDRFPPVNGGHRRDPYVISGVTGFYNELDYLGNFASFKDKDEDSVQVEDAPKYTYWQLTQSLLEKLEGLGIRESQDEGAGETITNIRTFIQTFKDIDSVVDSEVSKFVGSLMKNNVNFKETVKSVHHIIQFCCNPYWLPPCSVFLNLYYRCLLTILQDISLPSCMMYETDNPAIGHVPSDWLKMHYQTLWTNFKGLALDKGVLTGNEYRVVHKDVFCDFFDVDAAGSDVFAPVKLQVRISRALIVAPKNVKVKSRIVFSGTGGSEALQSSYVKQAGKKDNYIICGPYMKFLNAYHRKLFPGATISALFLWHTFSQKRKMPMIGGVTKEDMVELVTFVDAGSRIHEEVNVIDTVPDSFVAYAKQRLNNAILRACGQVQYYINTIHCLLPKAQATAAYEYPHVLGEQNISSVSHYMSAVQGLVCTTVQTTLREGVSTVGKLRPLVTLPMVVNKYTGVSGNNQVFHCGNLGYFMGRGVDRNLLHDPSGFRKQNPTAFMRKRHLFMTPLTGNLLKKSASNFSVPFEMETLRRNIQNLLQDKQGDPALFKSIILELVQGLGEGCAALTLDDLHYYLDSFDLIAEEILSRIQVMSEACGPWTPQWAEEQLSAMDADEQHSMETFEFVDLSNIADDAGAPAPMEDFVSPVMGPGNSRKRKINSVLGALDL